MINLCVQTGGLLQWVCGKCRWAIEATVATADQAACHACGGRYVRYGVAQALLVGRRWTWDDDERFPFDYTSAWADDPDIEPFSS